MKSKADIMSLFLLILVQVESNCLDKCVKVMQRNIKPQIQFSINLTRSVISNNTVTIHVTNQDNNTVIN